MRPEYRPFATVRVRNGDKCKNYTKVVFMYRGEEGVLVLRLRDDSSIILGAEYVVESFRVQHGDV